MSEEFFLFSVLNSICPDEHPVFAWLYDQRRRKFKIHMLHDVSLNLSACFTSWASVVLKEDKLAFFSF